MRKIIAISIVFLIMFSFVGCTVIVPSDSSSPYIEDGYWYIDGTNTGIKAEGVDGVDGKDGADGKDGVDGKDGTHWFVGESFPDNASEGDMFLNNSTWSIYCYNGYEWELKGNIKSTTEESREDAMVVDLVVFMGQSNMAGRGVASEAPIVPDGHGYEFRAVSDPTKLYKISEPFGVNENRGVLSEQIKTGSLVSAFAESYYQYTGVPIVGVSAAQGGKSITFWESDGEAVAETIARYNAAKAYLDENGYTVRHSFMVWLQGEADGYSGMSGDTYKTKLTELFITMNKHGIEKAMIIRIGDRQNSETIHDEIIRAQTELCAQSDDFVLISGKLAAIPLNEMKDNAHFKQYQYNEVGEDAGKNMAYYVNTGMEPYFYDYELGCYYPFGLDFTPDNEQNTPIESPDSFVLDISDPNLEYDLSKYGTVSNNKLHISKGSSTSYLKLDNPIVLSDDYSWTYEVVAGNFVGKGIGAGMIANSGISGSGFVTVPPSYPSEAAASSAQFRFRDEGKSFQIDVVVPADYDPTQVHHFALVYDASTRSFKAYIDKVECQIRYTVGSVGGAFNDTKLNNFFGGYPTAAESNFAGDFYYFKFTKDALSLNEMYSPS